MKKVLFEGSGVAIATPMHEDGSVNYEALGSLIEFQLDNGTDAIISCGTTGESSTLNHEEHCKVLEYTIKKVNHRVPVIAGAGSNDTAYAVELSKEAKSYGADALLSVTPYYNKCTPKGLQSHFARLASATPLPVILYNVPSRTGVTIDMESRRKLSKVDNIIGLKEASTDFSLIHQHLLELGDTLPLYSGNDDLTLPLMSLGAHGCISVLSNLLPHSTEALCQAILQNDLSAARSLHYSLLPLMKSLFCEVNPIPVKAAMPLVGFPCGSCRMPLSLIEPDHLALLQQQFTMTKQLGLC